MPNYGIPMNYEIPVDKVCEPPLPENSLVGVIGKSISLQEENTRLMCRLIATLFGEEADFLSGKTDPTCFLDELVYEERLSLSINNALKMMCDKVGA